MVSFHVVDEIRRDVGGHTVHSYRGDSILQSYLGALFKLEILYESAARADLRIASRNDS